MKSSKQWLVSVVGLLVLGTYFPGASSRANDQPLPHPAYRPATGTGTIPMFFEENVGQTDNSVRFVGRGRNYSVLVTDTEAVFKLAPSSPEEPSVDVRMSWVGADEPARVVSEHPLPGKSNYLLGNDPAAWKTNIPTFGKVRHEEVYPGVNLEFYGKGDLLEYDIVVNQARIPTTSDSGLRELKASTSMTKPATSYFRSTAENSATRRRSSISRRPPESKASRPTIPLHRTATSPSRSATMMHRS